MPPLTPRLISGRAQLEVLASPVRQELIDLLARIGPTSVAELGKLIRRPPDGLYYHLRELQRAGLVSSVNTKRRSGRNEALFRAVHQEPALRHDPSPGGNSPAVAAIVASMLRLGIRDFRKAAASAGIQTQGPRRELWALRVTGWLSPAEVAGVNRQMRALRDTVGKPRPNGRLYAITILLTPLDRLRKKHRRPRLSRMRKTR